MKVLRLFFLTLTISSLFAGLDEDLIEAAKNGDTIEVEELLDRGANVHAQDDFVLRWAARNGHTDTVRLLLDRGANIHARDDYALRCAAANGHTDTARLLLDRGANIHADENEALRFAAGNGHTDTVRLLLDRGANIHADDDFALIGAAYNGHTDTARLLLDHSANIHADENEALRFAAGNGHTDTARLLLDRGANIHARDDHALRWAAGSGHTDTARLLLDRGANVHALDVWAYTAHHHVVTLLEACGLKGFEEFREDPLAFIEDQKNAERPVPPQLMLLWSIILNREEAFDQLLNISMEAEEDTDEKTEVEESYDMANTMDQYHMTALMYAALFGNEHMCAKLVHAGAKINLKNRWGETAIQLAAGSGYWNIASYLLRRLKGKNIF
ncbi:MAG: hypothetical protein US13_C0017G0002 [candidate division TM6 bacterium GW2011_GWE2_36_25]|nr:MAG: hypothetical protein US03_C0017G0002 [candidate division TM6 bacterium GW2011_GWF2_36_131]KKQ02358.1 MAG: hypothetical protein US13_C0017G0002 [candidate division TM6 bacterium GW2011_GWE2_36_25]